MAAKHRRILLGLGVAMMAVSCQTAKAPKPVAEEIPLVEFRPATHYSRIHTGSGRYPNLVSAASFALWVSPEVAALKRKEAVEAGEKIDASLDEAAKHVGENYFVFECHIESVFPDASIAYDVVGLRNMDLYLLTPDGLKVKPIQRILGSHADEEERMALKLFRRTNILVFPKQDILIGQPTISHEAPAVRLVMEGFNSDFYFEWPAVDGAAPATPSAASRAYSTAKVGFSELFSKLKTLSHIFD